VRSVSRICARSSIVYVTYTIDKCAHMRETERTYDHALRSGAHALMLRAHAF